MLQDCIEIFKEELDKKTDKLVIDEYMPKDGTYMLVEIDNDKFIRREPIVIKYDKKQKVLLGKESSDYNYIACLDYYSKLIDMNKPIDSKKIIHSNNLYSFAIKKDSLTTGKLTSEIIDFYYSILKNPIVKYEQKKNARELYEKFEAENEPPNSAICDKINMWIKQNIFTLNDEIDLTGKDYFKIFFVYNDEEYTKKIFELESNRYLIPNIYNNNDYNIKVNSEIYGLPNNNVGMNAKKPFLESKSRKTAVPYLVNGEASILQNKLFDYLMGLAAKGKTNIYFDLDERTINAYAQDEFPNSIKSACFLRLRKGKEVEIHDVDFIADYNSNLVPSFTYKDLLVGNEQHNKAFSSAYDKSFGKVSNIEKLALIVDDIFFGKRLIYNYFTEPDDINISEGNLKNILLTYRNSFFEWFGKGNISLVKESFDKASMAIIENSVNLGYMSKIKYQLNLRWCLLDYLEGNERMEKLMSKGRDALRSHIDFDEWEFESDEEYFYAVGQLGACYLNMNKSIRKSPAMFNRLFKAKDDRIIKNLLQQYDIKYNYNIAPSDIRLKRLISHIQGYESPKTINRDLIYEGFYDNSILYMKKAADKNNKQINEEDNTDKKQ